MNVAEILQERKSETGRFELKHFEITSKNRPLREYIPNGKYIKLIDNNAFESVVMSNTPMERRTNSNFICNAHGDVFVAGLGIGMIFMEVQDKESIKSITVLEKYEEIIDMVAPQLSLNNKVTIICGNVFDYTFPKGTKFDYLYFDIWNYINSDVYEEMKLLKRKYLKYKRSLKENPNAAMKCWCEYEAKRNIRLM